MKAFGPYKDTETIDFRSLEDHRLFVISGATGAGKTTIFDGICFALYGTASGTDRDNTAMLRSHFADDDTHTSVELIFELHGRIYRVLRQLGHVKKGNKTKTGERYEFFEVIDNETEVPCVDRQIVSEINDKLEAIIGLTQDQFKQIVMLPQGEFRKLLTSETENKEAILRKLFRTERYKFMNQLLKDKKDNVEQQFRHEKQMLDHHIQRIHSSLEKREDSTLFQFLESEFYNMEQVVQGLDEEIIYYLEKIQVDEKNYENSLKLYEEKQGYLHKAITINERFSLLDQKNEELTQLKREKVTFLRMERQVDAAERANKIEPYEKQVADRRNERTELEKKAKIAATELEKAKTHLEQTQTAYKTEEQKESRREQLKNELTKYNEFLPIIQEIDQARNQLEQLTKTIDQTTVESNRLTHELKEKETAVEDIKKEIVQKEMKVIDRGKKQDERFKLLDQYRILDEYLKTWKTQRLLQAELEEKEKFYKLAERRYKKHETIWFKNQATVLASHLTNGDACPVCGSTHHPSKATLDEDHITKEELDEIKADLDGKQLAYQTILTKSQNNSDELKQKAQAVSENNISLEHAESEMENVLEKGKKLKAEILQIDHIAEQLTKDKQNLSKLETTIKESRLEKEKAEAHVSKLRTEFAQLDATFKERLRNIPDEMQDLAVLQVKLNQTETEKNKLEKRWQEVQEQLKQADKTYTEAKLHVIHIGNQLENVQSIVTKVEDMFKEYLNEAQFDSEEAYKQAKLPINEIELLKKEIELYKQKTVTVTKQVEELTEELKEKERADVESIQEQLKELKGAYEAALEQLNRSKKYNETATNIKESIYSVREKTAILEKKLTTVTDLYDVLRGQNDKKISFERYLQIDYLDQITNAANERFRTLTNGQFYLVRSERQEARGRQSGLAIDVYDAYTGQTRDVKSLSGGEKFIASLCLALGMSDVIQSFQGSVSMKTMFIDEGFGSLDEESLHKSIDALVSLQETGRMIGVISHVEELKTVFPAMLEVNKNKEGYSKTRFVLK